MAVILMGVHNMCGNLSFASENKLTNDYPEWVTWSQCSSNHDGSLCMINDSNNFQLVLLLLIVEKVLQISHRKCDSSIGFTVGSRKCDGTHKCVLIKTQQSVPNFVIIVFNAVFFAVLSKFCSIF